MQNLSIQRIYSTSVIPNNKQRQQYFLRFLTCICMKNSFSKNLWSHIKFATTAVHQNQAGYEMCLYFFDELLSIVHS